MTREELSIRKDAVLAAYLANDKDSACNHMLQLYNSNPNKKLYRFRPPEEHDVEALRNGQIYLSRPKYYTDNKDCEWIDDLPALVEYDLKVRNKEKYAHYKGKFTKELYNSVAEKVASDPRYMEMRENARNRCLTACITDKMTEYLWEKYAKQNTGMCFEYDFEEVLDAVSKMKSVLFFPVWYVEDRTETPEIKFGVKEYEDESGDAMHQKYILSSLTKDITPYAQESEWRLLCTEPDIAANEKGKRFDFIYPERIYLGKNIEHEFERKILGIAEQFGIEVKTQR